MFHNKINFYIEELPPRPNPKLEDHPLSAVRNCLFNILAAILHFWGRSSIRNLRTRHAMVTATLSSRKYYEPKYKFYFAGEHAALYLYHLNHNMVPLWRQNSVKLYACPVLPDIQKRTAWFQRFQASNICPSDGSSFKMKMSMGHWWYDIWLGKTESIPSKSRPPTATLMTIHFTQTALVLNPGRRSKKSGLTACLMTDPNNKFYIRFYQ